MTTSNAALPLAGMRVLDLTRLMPGALCTLILADLGAEVIKIEAPEAGDYMRTLLPEAFEALNRNKRSVVLNLKTEEGVDALLQLVKGSDVLVESFRPGVMDRLGLSTDRLHKTNSRLVVCALSGFGQTGERAQQAAHDLNYMSLSGLMAGLDYPLTVQMADIGGALCAVSAVLAGLLRREHIGQGAFIDAALLDGGLLATIMLRAEAHPRGTLPTMRKETLSGGLACYGLYDTADGKQMALAALEGQFFKAFCEAVRRPDLFPSHWDPARQDWLRQELATLFASKTRDEWVTLLETAGDTCCTPVLDMREAADDPGVRARGLWVEANGVAHLRSPVRLAGADSPPITPAPELGADTEDILGTPHAD